MGSYILYASENERMSPEKGQFQKEVSSSKRKFQEDMLVFEGVYDMISMCVYTNIKHAQLS